MILADFANHFVHEKDGNPALLTGIVATNFQKVNIIPAISRKRVVDHWRSKQEPNLILCHGNLNLVEIFLLNQVSL